MQKWGLLLYRFFSSMRLSVYLLGFGVLLVFFGTLDQVHYGIWETQRRYFQSIIAFWQYPLTWPGGQVLGFLVLPLPGGYLLGFCLLVNLFCAHFWYFKPRLRNLGIVLIHGGVVLLLVGQLVTDLGQEDYQMWLDEGGSRNYAESFHHDELVLIERLEGDIDRVASVDASLLKKGREFELDGFPVTVRVQRFMRNARIMRLPENQDMALVRTSHGIASDMRLGVLESPPTYRHNERNITTALVELRHAEGVVGNWLVSNVFPDNLPRQFFEWEGRQFEIALRFKRQYFPFSVHLDHFSHDRYPGTDIPRNFSSDVRVTHLETGEVRDALIYMNHPLRHGGFTFYQASFGNDDTSSMLQVVRNPGWLIPYLSCLIMSVGLTYQFGWSLFVFLGRMKK